MPNILTFDLGTTYFKACVFDSDGRLLALARRDTPVMEPRPEWREIAPSAFIETVTELARELRDAAPRDYEGITDISFATQTNTFVLLDENDEPLRPFIVWNDRRAAGLAARATELSADPSFRPETGIPALSPGFSLIKLLWVQEHEPHVLRSARRFCLLGDYLTFWLTGEHVTEGGAAGLTALLDVHKMGWRRPVLTRLGLDHIAFPEPRFAGAVVGPLRREAAEALALRRECRCVLGCLDQYAGAIGAGNVECGGVSETTGTVLAAVALSDRFEADLHPSVFQGPTWRPGLWWRMSFDSVSANLLEALRRAEPGTPSYETLNAEAAAVGAEADGLRLDGPASVDASRPVFIGEQARHGRGHRVRAVLQGVADALQAQASHLGGAPADRPVRSVGGAARSRLWLQMKADTLGATFQSTDCPEPTSLGAAVLAVAARTGGGVDATASRMVKVAETIAPRALRTK